MALKDEKLVCELCNRTESFVTKHHLLPKQQGGKHSATVNLCQPCHSTIHLHFTNAELARNFWTVEALQTSERLQKYLHWIRNKILIKSATEGETSADKIPDEC